MIEVKNISKIYGRGKKKVVALDNVSFVLPDSGMVFVVGKSGCGKSTLLNMIGGCDKLTSGDIVMDGNSFSAFRERDYDNFRDDYVGFIFQDYCLLDGLTVEQNVSLALELKGENDDEAVKDALDKVGLSDCAARRPDALSGGQKQRVAIARVLVKKPKLILADEPTGNLDEKSSGIILDILKEMSKTALVVIVSHDRPDAEKYADRILELSNGRIISDISRNKSAEGVSLDGQYVVIQKGAVFTDAEIEKINESMAAGARLRQEDTKFLPTIPPHPNKNKREFASNSMNFRGKKRLFFMLMKKRGVGMAVSALCAVFLFLVLGVCQFFTQFDGNTETARILRERNGTVFAMRKGYLDEEDPTKEPDTSRLLRVTDEEAAAFYADGYEGDIFPLYSVSLLTNESKGADYSIQSYRMPSDGRNYNKFYCNTGLGVLQVTERYLTDLYGKDGKLNVLSGEMTSEGDGVIVTDYFADSLLAYNVSLRATAEELAENGDRYAKIADGHIFNGRYRVSAVIDTGYKERYAPLIQAWQSGQKISDIGEIAVQFYEELTESLNIAYTLNPNFMDAYNADDDRYFALYGRCDAEVDGHVGELSPGHIYFKEELQDDEILIDVGVYCNITGDRAAEFDTTSVVGKKIKLGFGDVYSDEHYFEREFTIVGAFPSGEAAFYVSQQTLSTLRQYSVYAYALYFDNVESAIRIYESATERGYFVQSPLFSAIYSVSRTAKVFIELFDIIIWVIYALVGLTLVALGVGTVRKNMYEIAVVRALGGKSGDLAGMFLLQMILVSAFVCLFAGLGLWLGADLCNMALAEGFVSVTKNAVMREIRFIGYSWTTVMFDAGIMFGLTLLCAAVPLLILRHAKPREIIRAKE